MSRCRAWLPTLPFSWKPPLKPKQRHQILNRRVRQRRVRHKRWQRRGIHCWHRNKKKPSWLNWLTRSARKRARSFQQLPPCLSPASTSGSFARTLTMVPNAEVVRQSAVSNLLYISKNFPTHCPTVRLEFEITGCLEDSSLGFGEWTFEGMTLKFESHVCWQTTTEQNVHHARRTDARLNK